MKKAFTGLSAVLFSLLATAQQDTTQKMDEIIVYANKFAEKKKNIAQEIEIISAKTIAKFNAQNTGDALINTGNVYVQKSQQGGSSPVVRGFEASRLLLVVDGIRMNNAIYRSGHLQNVITVDQNMLENIEVLYGPASTIFGSDALGGAVHFRTKKPLLSTTGRTMIAGTGFARYSSANNEVTGHADVSIGGKKFAWLQSYTYSNFGDMTMGKNYPTDYPGFGRRDSVIVTSGGIDNVVANSDKQEQKYSGYKQWDILQKFLFKQSEKVSHSMNLQLSNSTDVPRYDRLQDKRNFGGALGTTLRYAEWFYGPQKRNSGTYRLDLTKLGFADELSITVNYQDIEESRQTREYRRYDRFDSRVEKLEVWNFTVESRKKMKQHELTTGIDGQLNKLKSIGTRTNLTSGAVTPLDSRYPDGKNNVKYFGLFVEHIIKNPNGKFVYNQGLRFQSVSLLSTIVNNSFFNLPYTRIDQDNFAFTGHLGVVFLPSEDFRFTSNLSSGFRAPNIDDLVKIFESSTAAKQVVFPNPDIKPERTYTWDITFNHTIAKKIKFEFSVYHTWFRNALVKAPFQINGQDSVVYNGVYSQVLANQNRNKAFVTGFNSNIEFRFKKYFSLRSTINYTYGRYKKYTGAEVPLDHIPPVFGTTSLSFAKNKIETELYALYNGWKQIEDYNPDGEDNQQYATPDGMPAWFVLSWRGSINLNKNFKLQAGVENILDRNYRTFGSGFSSAGRNFIIALRADIR
jgi:hemoglobin/transferrin/lactoferrin receptor protein